MKVLRLKVLALVGSGAFMLAVSGCAPTQLITELLGQLGKLFTGA